MEGPHIEIHIGEDRLEWFDCYGDSFNPPARYKILADVFNLLVQHDDLGHIIQNQNRRRAHMVQNDKKRRSKERAALAEKRKQVSGRRKFGQKAKK